METEYTINVYGGDVGGLDLTFSADSLEAARRLARAETPSGTRGTEIIDQDGCLVEVVE